MGMGQLSNSHKKIGIPIEEVNHRLKALNESLLQNDMALKANTDIHIDLSRNNAVLGFVLEVVVLSKDEEEEKAE